MGAAITTRAVHTVGAGGPGKDRSDLGGAVHCIHGTALLVQWRAVERAT